MWSRVIILMLSFWLLAAPFIREPSEISMAFHLVNGFILATLSCFSMSTKFEKTSFLVFAHGLFLFLYGRFYFDHPHPPSVQGIIVIGLLVCMIVIIPLRDQVPPNAIENGMAEKDV